MHSAVTPPARSGTSSGDSSQIPIEVPDIVLETASRILGLAARARRRVVKEVLDPAGLRLVEWDILWAIAQTPWTTTDNVCASLGIEPRSATAVFTALQSAAWISLQPTSAQEGSESLHITRSGIDLVMSLAGAVAKAETFELGRLSHEELTRLNSRLADCDYRNSLYA